MSTIAAISTSPGIGGIGIVRMSGEECFEILNKIFKPKTNSDIKAYTMKYGNIINPKTNEIIDEVLVSYFISPKSYTTENMCEINSHGSQVVMKKILELCLENGANLAEPGEFTKKAFLNGRIDLSQAEAVIDLINSKTEKEAESSIKQLEGFLSKEILKIKKDILDLLTEIEVSIDYPEYDDIEEVTNNKAIEKLNNIKNALENLENSYKNGKIIREGIKTAIIGTPNAGKSSLLNAILKEDRAIVTEYEGTTRDTIEEYISVYGIPLKIIDTAGIRNAKDEVEKIGIEKSREIANSSDLIIAIFDSSKKLSSEDLEILELVKDKNTIIVINKIDLGKIEIELDKIKNINKPIIKISAKNKEGIENLYEQIKDLFSLNDINIGDENIITNVRHLELIKRARQSALNAIDTINNQLPIDIISINIKDIIEALNTITGENATEDLINDIFSKFCLGK